VSIAGSSLIRSSEEEETRIAILREKMERIREDKKRLQRIQELRELGESTKAEILESQRRIIDH